MKIETITLLQYSHLSELYFIPISQQLSNAGGGHKMLCA